MKATGIVRKVDELGRIVIPMELRKILDIDPRDPLEIFTEDDKIILRKYSDHQSGSILQVQNKFVPIKNPVNTGIF